AGEIPQARVDLVGRAVVADLHAHEGPPHADVDAPGRTDVEVVVELAGVAVDATAERHPGARAPPLTALGPGPDLRGLQLLEVLALDTLDAALVEPVVMDPGAGGVLEFLQLPLPGLEPPARLLVQLLQIALP